MLLLILFAGCLASCSSQTTSFPLYDREMSPMTPPLFTESESIEATSVLLTSNSTDNVVAILQTVVWSYQELNETAVAPVLNQLYGIIQHLQPDLNFSLTVKSLTRV